MNMILGNYAHIGLLLDGNVFGLLCIGCLIIVG